MADTEIHLDSSSILSNLKEIVDSFVDGTPEGDEVLRKIYPSHIYHPMRRKLAMELAGKEIAKILDAENNQRLDEIRKATDDLYEGRRGVYAPVHDFWSFVEMILHVKKKELPELITAENVIWNLEELLIDDLHITWMPFLEEHKDIFGEKPWPAKDLTRVFSENKDIFKKAKANQEENAWPQQHNFDQSDEPIELIKRSGELELIDGNGRLYRALLDGKEKVSCWVGEMEGKMPKHYFVSAGALKQFCLEVRGYAAVDDLEGFASGVSYLRTKLRTNKLALINYELFLREDFPEFEKSLKGILS